jgi:hypothetical protein
MDAAQTHLAPYYIYIYICKRTQHVYGQLQNVFGYYWTDLGWANGQPGKKKQALSFIPLLFSFIVN